MYIIFLLLMLWRQTEGINEVQALYTLDAEFTQPFWNFGFSSYDFLQNNGKSTNYIACTYRFVRYFKESVCFSYCHYYCCGVVVVVMDTFLLVLSHIFGSKLFIQLYSIKVVVYDVQAEWPIIFGNPG